MKQTIVIVEDNSSIREVLCDLLASLNCRVLAYESAEIMLKEFEKFDASLYLIDYELPGMHGDKLISIIKENQPLSNVFMISFNAEISQIENVYSRGADHYITKPFDADSLLTKVNNALTRSRNLAAINIYSGIKLNPEAFVISFNGNMRKMSEREFSVFSYLHENQSQVSTRQELLKVIGMNCDERNVDSCVSDIRKTISGLPLEIKSVRGAGYKLLYSK